MSSSASTTRTAATAQVVPAAVPAARVTVAPPDDDLARAEAVDRSYLHAIGVGALVGIVAFIAVAWVAVKALAPDWPAGAVLAIAGWTGLWSGMFLGGTIAVGRWSARQGH